MAKKKKPGGIKTSFEGLEAGLKGLGVVEKELAGVRENLRKFLDQAEIMLSGHPHQAPTDMIPPTKPARRKRPRAKTPRR